MLAKRFNNAKLGIELTSYIDNKQNIWFQGKDIAKILGYSDTDQAIRKHVDEQDKYKGPVVLTGYSKRGRPPIFINESGFYPLVLSSKLETAKKFKKWVTSQVLPSIRKFGYYKLFDNPNNKMFNIANEMDLHCKVVQLMRNYYPDAIMVAGLGENQDTANKRIISWKKGYLRGQPDLMILNCHKDFHGLCIEFKSPTNKYQIFQSQGMYLFLELILQELVHKQQIHFYTTLLICQIMLKYQDVTWKWQMETNTQIFTLNLLQI